MLQKNRYIQKDIAVLISVKRYMCLSLLYITLIGILVTFCTVSVVGWNAFSIFDTTTVATPFLIKFVITRDSDIKRSRFKDPVLAGFILGKLSFARESGAELIINGEGIVPEPDDSDMIHEVITILGNLIDNGLEAVQSSSRKSISLRFDYYDSLLVLEVHDTEKGIDDDG